MAGSPNRSVLEMFTDVGVTDLAPTRVEDGDRIFYTNARGDILSPTQAGLAIAERAEQQNLPPVTAEDVLRSSSPEETVDENEQEDDFTLGMNDQTTQFTPINYKGKERAIDEIDEEDNQDEEDELEDENESSQLPSGKRSATKAPITPKKRTKTTTTDTPSSGPRLPRYAEVKEWTQIKKLHTEGGHCPDDINDMVETIERKTGKKLSKRYNQQVLELKARGFDNNAEEVARLRHENETLTTKLAKARKEIAQLKQTKTKPTTTKTTVTPAKKRSKASVASSSKVPATPDRPTVSLPMSTMPTISMSETIIDTGIGLVRSVGADDWEERADNWVTVALGRARVVYQ